MLYISECLGLYWYKCTHAHKYLWLILPGIFSFLLICQTSAVPLEPGEWIAKKWFLWSIKSKLCWKYVYSIILFAVFLLVQWNGKEKVLFCSFLQDWFCRNIFHLLSKLRYRAFLNKALYCSNDKIPAPWVVIYISNVKYAIKVQKGTETYLCHIIY